jgi:hypothetical protein
MPKAYRGGIRGASRYYMKYRKYKKNPETAPKRWDIVLSKYPRFIKAQRMAHTRRGRMMDNRHTASKLVSFQRYLTMPAKSRARVDVARWDTRFGKMYKMQRGHDRLRNRRKSNAHIRTRFVAGGASPEL